MSRQLSTRERNLSIAVGSIAFVLVTFFVFEYFTKNKARLQADLVTKTRQLKTMQSLDAEKALWVQRDAWLLEKQPKLANADSAGPQLLNEVKELAKKHTVLIDSSKFSPTGVRKTETPYIPIGIEVETKSTWRALIAFLSELQTPEQFVVLDSANLKIDAADATQMRGKFKIARWYAPK